MESVTKEKRVLQWHPAFYAGLIIEFRDEEKKVYFENEHQLGTKPKEIDVLIIKKNSEEPIEKNIGRIFRKHNIVEYKSPEDYLSIDDFYQVYGYACFYKADVQKVDSIKADEITISFVCKDYPRKLIAHLTEVRHLEISRYEKGIYYITGDIFAMQLILTSELSKENNFWLRNLTNDIKEPETIREIAEEYGKHRNNGLYQSIMNVIVRANEKKFMEESAMCEAIRELFKDEYEAGIKQATELGIQQGIQQGMQQGVQRGALQQLVELVRDNLLSMDEAVKRANISKEEFMAKL